MSTPFPVPERPVVSAPMAGGPTTPALVAAVNDAGGLGLLAGGYLTGGQLSEQVRRTRELTQRPFGVGLFVPGPVDRDGDERDVQRYAELVEKFAGELARPGEPRWDDDDHYREKIEVLVRERPAVASFIFGVPEPEVIARLQDAGCSVLVTVTSADEAQAATRAGADALCVQGTQAGGHRGTHRVRDDPEDLNWAELLPMIQDVTSVPLIVAGGIVGPDDVAQALGQGAVACQCGTAFLLTDEAGTSAAHRAGLVDPELTTTTVTRAFSGRPARSLTNRFVTRLGDSAPPAYPMVNHVTRPVRTAAAQAGDTGGVSLWAGTGWREIKQGPAADVMDRLCP